jgi:hypothetical protein
MSEHTPAYKIFHYYFMVMIPAAYAYQNDQAMLGVYQYQSKEAEESAAQEMVTRQHTVAEMVEYWKAGARLILCNPKDSETIYGWIREHVQGKMNKLGTSLNVGNVPIQDLKDLDDFARSIYQVARNYEEGGDIREAALVQKAETIFRRRGGLRRQRPSEQEESAGSNAPAEKPAPREHDPMADEISRLALERQLPNL